MSKGNSKGKLLPCAFMIDTKFPYNVEMGDLLHLFGVYVKDRRFFRYLNSLFSEIFSSKTIKFECQIIPCLFHL